MFLIKKTTEETSDDTYLYYYYCDQYKEAIEAFEGGYDLSKSKGFYDDFENLQKLLEEFKTLVGNAENKGKTEREKAKSIDINSFEEEQRADELFYNAIGYFSYRQFTYKSLFFIAFTAYENRLHELSRLIDSFIISPIILPKLHCHVKKYQEYLESNLTGFKFNEYPDLKFYTDVRNAFHHRNALFEPYPKFEEWLNNQQGITFQPHDGINQIVILNSEFIVNYIKLVKTVLNALTTKARDLQPVKAPN